MGHVDTSRLRARKRAGRRNAPLSAPAHDEVLELLRAVEIDDSVEDSDPLLETPDVFEPEPDIEFDAVSLTPTPPSSLARALAVAVNVEEACEANDNAELTFVVPDAIAEPASPASPAVQPAPESLSLTSDEDAAPFDAPDQDDEIFQKPNPKARRWSDPADVLDLHTVAPPSFPHEPSDVRPPVRPSPAISIHVNWDRSAGASLAEQLAAQPLLARTDISDARGGIGGAPATLAKGNAPDVLILETTLKAGPLLQAIDALQPQLNTKAKLFIVGDVNDVTLLRELARRGIIHYFLAPADPEEIARAICDLHAEADKSRVVAVVGSRGGVGSSTIAHNLAWSLAERYDASTTLIELDVAFGATAFSFDQRPSHSLAEGVRDPQSINEAFLDRVGVMQTERLRLIAAPATLADVVALERPAVGALIRNARRLSKVVVLDVPHHWDACIKDVLERANDVLIVATPDLASLRNAKNLLEVLKSLRPAGHEPLVLLSMAGASKTSEISAKDFAGALDAQPTMTFDFDPALFAGSALKRQMLGETAPQSLPARQIDDLAALITGRRMVKRRKSARKAAQRDEAVLDQATSPKPEVVEELAAQTPEAVKSEVIFELTNAIAADSTPTAPRRSRPRALSRRQCEPQPLPKRRPPQPGTLRLAAALMALLAASMWYVEKSSAVDFIGYAIASGH